MEGHVLNENDIAALLPPRRRESSKGFCSQEARTCRAQP